MRTRFIILGLTVPLFLGAASGTGAILTGTGGTMYQNDTNNDRRKGAADYLRTNMDYWNGVYSKWRALTATENTERMRDRSLCRGEIRQANRDTLFDIQVRCLRRDMSAWKIFLLKQEDIFRQFPGLPSAISPILQKSLTLRVALNAIITALDSGVFYDEAQMLEAKRNLRTKYAAPLNAAMDEWRVAQLQNWLHWFVNEMDTVDDEGSVVDRASWDQLRTCLTEQEDWRGLSGITTQKMTENMRLCLEQFPSVLEAQKSNSGSTLTGTGGTK